MSRGRARGWGFAIDYDKEIAMDKANVALYAEGGPVDCLWWALTPRPAGADDARNAYDVLVLAAFVGIDALRAVANVAGIGVNDALLVAWQYAMDAHEAPLHELDAALGMDVEEVLRAKIQAGEIVEPDSDKLSLYGHASRASNRVATTLENIPMLSPEQRKKALAKARASLSRHTRNQAKFGAAS